MKIRSRAGAREMLANRPLVGCVGGVAVMAMVAATLLAYGLAVGSHRDAGDGRTWLLYSLSLMVPGTVGWRLKGRQRKMKVERKLDLVMGGLDRVEELLAPGGAHCHLAVVRDHPGMRS